MLRTLTLSDARRIMQRGRPWTFCLEYHDPGANSHKFWLATGRARHEPVEVHYERVGGKHKILIKDWMYIETKAPEKVAKGYDYVPHQFVKVQASTIAAFNAKNAKRAPKSTPKPKPASQPSAATPKPQPSVPGTLAGPYAKVVGVSPRKAGIWHALDALGNKVLVLTKQGARDLVARNPNIQVVGL